MDKIIKQACINEEISKDSFRSLIIYFIPDSKKISIGKFR